MPKNKMSDLRSHLFETLEALKDDAKPMDVDRARAVCEVAQALINTAKVEVQFLDAIGAEPSSWIFPSCAATILFAGVRSISRAMRMFCWSWPIEAMEERAIMKRELEKLVTLMRDGGISYDEAVRQFKRRFLIEVLARHRWNQCKAAKELGMHRNTLGRLVAELCIYPRLLRHKDVDSGMPSGLRLPLPLPPVQPVSTISA